MINQTLFAVSDNESRPVYTGSLFEMEAGLLTLVSVDGYRLALRREKMAGGSGEVSFIVPGNALSDLEKICADSDDPVGITVGSKHISFSIGNTVLISRRLEGEFLNYRKAVPETFRYTMKAERQELCRVVDRVSLIIDDRVKNPIRCRVGDGAISMTCVTALGRADDVCPVEGSGEGLEISFNNRYLLDALKAAPADKVSINMSTSSSPCVILPSDGGDSFLYMILPVRLKAGE